MGMSCYYVRVSTVTIMTAPWVGLRVCNKNKMINTLGIWPQNCTITKTKWSNSTCNSAPANNTKQSPCTMPKPSARRWSKDWQMSPPRMSKLHASIHHLWHHKPPTPGQLPRRSIAPRVAWISSRHILRMMDFEKGLLGWDLTSSHPPPNCTMWVRICTHIPHTQPRQSILSITTHPLLGDDEWSKLFRFFQPILFLFQSSLLSYSILPAAAPGNNLTTLSSVAYSALFSSFANRPKEQTNKHECFQQTTTCSQKKIKNRSHVFVFS